MACELAGSDYSFSPFGPRCDGNILLYKTTVMMTSKPHSHWASISENYTCPDLVVDPTFIHYLPMAHREPVVMSMNQFKYRHLKKFEGTNKKKRKFKDDSKLKAKLLATSSRQTRVEQIRDYRESLKTCSSAVKPMRKVQRCWSRYVRCDVMNEKDMSVLRRHAALQASCHPPNPVTPQQRPTEQEVCYLISKDPCTI